jgi:hypothetical protein
MELSPTPDPTSFVGTGKFFRILWNSKVHYRIHKSSLLVPILGQTSPAHTTHPISTRFILIFSPLSLGLPVVSFLLRFLPISYKLPFTHLFAQIIIIIIILI